MELKCHICGCSIDGIYRTNRYNNCVCSSHIDTPVCFCCGRFCNNYAKYITQHYIVCKKCQQKRIENDTCYKNYTICL